MRYTLAGERYSQWREGQTKRMEKPLAPVEVFYSCSDSPADAPLLEQLERHLSALRSTLEHLELARTQQNRVELAAEELRLAHEALSAITGQYTADELLGEIFSRFCIGK